MQISIPVSIIIPVYKEDPSPSEIISLKQCISVLSKYPIIFICRKELNVSKYKEILSPHTNYSFSYFHKKYFEKLEGYNQLLLNRMFYTRFTSSKYILIYQLDSYVFKDELEYWCNEGYDYVGAPWFEGYGEASIQSKPIGVGNGGFSLRNVKSSLRVLQSFSYIESPLIIFKRFTKNKSLSEFIYMLKMLSIQNNTFFLFNNFKNHEDGFWGIIAKNKFKWFQVAPINVALKFSIEVLASHYVKSKNCLPFGCHAWEKREPEFWKQYIS